MKYIQSIIHLFNHHRCLVIGFLMLGLISPAYTQTGEEAPEEIQSDTTAEEAAEETIEKQPLRMSFEAFKIDQHLKLVARVRSKVVAKFQNTAGVEVSFYKEEVSAENFIGKDTSNQKGEAIWIIPVDPANTVSLTFLAAVQDHPDYEDAEEMVTVNPSVITMELAEEDSMRIVKIFIGYPNDSGQVVPVTEAECKLFVKRLFGNMPLGDPETTDEEGNITIEFPGDIKGDSLGNITLIAKVAEHELLGNVETGKTIGWGIPVEKNDFYSQRQLWSARANSPIILIVVVNAAIIGIWGVISFIFLEIYRINKLGKAN